MSQGIITSLNIQEVMRAQTFSSRTVIMNIMKNDDAVKIIMGSKRCPCQLDNWFAENVEVMNVSSK